MSTTKTAPEDGKSRDRAARLEEIRLVGVIAVIRAPDAASAIKGVRALVAGGVTGIEITYSTPDAPAVIADLRREHGEAILLGAGTVLSAEQANDAAAAGAGFLVSPGCTPKLAAAMLSTSCTTLLGAMTPTEVIQAVDLGAHVVKLFPASLGGPGYLKSLRGPFPDVPLMPTGGVNVANLSTWLDAGAIAVGVGSELCSAADLREGRWTELEAKAADLTAALIQWRERDQK